jgi:enamine deaminase RidA (YjgF/YER057c/UK114 family)
MSYKVINVPEGSKVPAPPPKTWSNIKIHKNGHFYVAGMVADGSSTYEQARQIFTDIQDLIKAAGGVMNDIISIWQIHITIQIKMKRRLNITKNVLNLEDGTKKYGIVIIELGYLIKI